MLLIRDMGSSKIFNESACILKEFHCPILASLLFLLKTLLILTHEIQHTPIYGFIGIFCVKFIGIFVSHLDGFCRAWSASCRSLLLSDMAFIAFGPSSKSVMPTMSNSPHRIRKRRSLLRLISSQQSPPAQPNLGRSRMVAS